MGIDLKLFNKGSVVDSTTHGRKNWSDKIINTLDNSDSLMTRTELRDKLNMSSVQEVKQYCDKLVKSEKIIAKEFDNAPAKYYYTTQKALDRFNKSSKKQ